MNRLARTLAWLLTAVVSGAIGSTVVAGAHETEGVHPPYVADVTGNRFDGFEVTWQDATGERTETRYPIAEKMRLCKGNAAGVHRRYCIQQARADVFWIGVLKRSLNHQRAQLTPPPVEPESPETPAP